ncbi:MAG: hypothetical protein K0R66_1440 [Gammaproteobacteria bacterium]|jgi:hypothetical protein|nr:hypothetical protein [Gammaproteobacteria bacterium]
MNNALKLLVAFFALCAGRTSEATSLKTVLNGLGTGPSTLDFLVNGTANCSLTALGTDSSLYLIFFNSVLGGNCTINNKVTIKANNTYCCSFNSTVPVAGTLYSINYAFVVDCEADQIEPRSAIFSPG